jgi:hypothetical protein
MAASLWKLTLPNKQWIINGSAVTKRSVIKNGSDSILTQNGSRILISDPKL